VCVVEVSLVIVVENIIGLLDCLESDRGFFALSFGDFVGVVG
jgi:hypothetical protein